MPENILYYGDNIGILRRYIKDESVDLVYLDPPFKSNQDYNILFAEKNGAGSASQIKAFEDTWHWNLVASRAFEEVRESGGRAAEAMVAFQKFLGNNDMLAYLSMMAPRLAELRRVLKPTGSIYLHCDPTASHYLKLLMDAVFRPMNFKNEIIWKRTSAHSDSHKYGSNVDILLYYTKSENRTWNPSYTLHDKNYLKRFRNQDPDGGRWADYDLSAKGLTGGGYEYEYKGVKSLWRCPLSTMEKLDEKGRLHFTKAGGIRLKRYLNETKGVSLQSLWDDISPINSQAKERLGYPTQKPEALLERIVQASSNEGDMVLDPFCGCGTAVHVAQRLQRSWIGIDITCLATTLIKNRLRDAFGEDVQYKVIGEPVSLPDAQALAIQNPFQFQYWALGLVHARPAEQRRGADQGIDGRYYFDSSWNPKSKTGQIVISVKSGQHVGVTHVRDLGHVVSREEAEMGALITLHEPTRPMREEAAGAGFYESPWGKHPRLQIRTVSELLAGKGLDCPPQRQTNITFKKAPKAKRSGKAQGQNNLDL